MYQQIEAVSGDGFGLANNAQANRPRISIVVPSDRVDNSPLPQTRESPKQILMRAIAFMAMRMLIAARAEKTRRPAPPVEVVATTHVIRKAELPARVTAWGRVRTVADIELSPAEGTVLAGD